MMNLWSQFKKSKTSFAAFWILIIIASTAIYAPFLSNNKPLLILTKNQFIFTDYLDSAYGTLDLIIEELKAGQNPSQSHIIWFKKSLDESLAFIQSIEIKSKFYQFPIDLKIQQKNIKELNHFKDSLIYLKDSKLTPRFFFPVFNSLSSGDLFFMLIIPLFFLFRQIFKKIKKTKDFTIIQTIFLTLIVSLFFSILFQCLKHERLDSYNYKKMSIQFQSGEWALFPIVPFGENENRMSESSQPPTLFLGDKKPGQEFHLLGTDTNGRDVLSRMIWGSRISMSVGFVAVSIYVFLGIIIGALAGFYGGAIDIAISRLIEIMICFPVFFLILTVMAFLKPSIINIMVIIGLTGWTGIARLMRGEFLRLKNQEFVLAAQSLGASDFRLIFRHIFPNGINPILISATFGIAGAILVESALSFLGFGVPQPTASWGDLLNNGRNDIYGTWWLTVFPGIAIFITVTSFNLIGEKLRDLLDPKMKER